MKKLITILFVLMFCGMAQGILIKNGETSVITYFVLRDRTAGTVDTGVTIANIDTYYIEEGALISSKTDLAAHAAGDDAWDATPQGYHMGYGVYRVDWPNAAFDGGVGKTVQLIVIDGDAGAFTEIMEVELSAPVDVITVAGTAQTANDNGADINTLITEVAEADANNLLILADTSAQDTAAEMKTLVWSSTMADMAAGAPAYNASIFDATNWIYQSWRNKTVTTGSEVRLYKNDASTIATEADISDDGSNFTKSEYRAPN